MGTKRRTFYILVRHKTRVDVSVLVVVAGEFRGFYEGILVQFNERWRKERKALQISLYTKQP